MHYLQLDKSTSLTVQLRQVNVTNCATQTSAVSTTPLTVYSTRERPEDAHIRKRQITGLAMLGVLATAIGTNEPVHA